MSELDTNTPDLGFTLRVFDDQPFGAFTWETISSTVPQNPTGMISASDLENETETEDDLRGDYNEPDLFHEQPQQSHEGSPENSPQPKQNLVEEDPDTRNPVEPAQSEPKSNGLEVLFQMARDLESAYASGMYERKYVALETAMGRLSALLRSTDPNGSIQAIYERVLNTYKNRMTAGNHDEPKIMQDLAWGSEVYFTDAQIRFLEQGIPQVVSEATELSGEICADCDRLTDQLIGAASVYRSFVATLDNYLEDENVRRLPAGLLLLKDKMVAKERQIDLDIRRARSIKSPGLINAQEEVMKIAQYHSGIVALGEEYKGWERRTRWEAHQAGISMSPTDRYWVNLKFASAGVSGILDHPSLSGC
ncbi:hypothetical protein TWF481_010751 [Arthrobotrys musiformis]|uniref:Uncharacterized protein n=1 Tax=Arthrobotrys musiformis TaxID=47236 RepID=A0AAV9W1U1_9PEZI